MPGTNTSSLFKYWTDPTRAPIRSSRSSTGRRARASPKGVNIPPHGRRNARRLRLRRRRLRRHGVRERRRDVSNVFGASSPQSRWKLVFQHGVRPALRGRSESARPISRAWRSTARWPTAARPASARRPTAARPTRCPPSPVATPDSTRSSGQVDVGRVLTGRARRAAAGETTRRPGTAAAGVGQLAGAAGLRRVRPNADGHGARHAAPVQNLDAQHTPAPPTTYPR